MLKVRLLATWPARTRYGVVRVHPELVAEIAFDGVQASRRYPGGVALRFARVIRYREDKRPDEADTITAVRAFWQEGQPAEEDDQELLDLLRHKSS
jgi:ATP-dependent DNA ligase